MNDLNDAKVAVRQARSKGAVYDALMKAGISPERNLRIAMKQARDSFRHREAELIQVAIARLQQIEEGGV